MKRESNGGLFFLLAVGIVGLGLYFGASENYSAGELQLYHIICWVVLLIALLRILELIWEPVRSLWDQAWGKAWEKTEEHHSISSQPEQKERVSFSSEPEREEGSHSAYSGKDSCEEAEKIRRADGVIIMPDRSSHLYLDDRCREAEKNSGREYDPSEEFSFRPVSSEVEKENQSKQTPEQSDKKKDKKKKKKK